MSSGKKKRPVYSFSRGGLYLSIISTILSVFLAFLLLKISTLLLYYIFLTFLITALIFALKIGVISLYISKLWTFFQRSTATTKKKEEISETPKKGINWRASLLFLVVAISVLFFPLILAKFLDPYVWFLLLISFTSGISISEIAFYHYAVK